MPRHFCDTIDHDIAIDFGSLALGPNEMETAMCTTTFGTLTLAGMLNDPLIQAVMRSDHVSEDDYAALLSRVKDTLADRELDVERGRRLADADRAFS